MFAYIVRRILATIPVMVVVALFVFSLLHLSPGDPAAIIAGDTATADDIARIRQKLGLDQPLYIQFVTWVWGLLHGDLGISIFTNLPVSKLIAQRIEPTVTLTVSTLIVSVIAAIPMGVLAAWKAGSWIDRVVMIFAVLGFSVPDFTDFRERNRAFTGLAEYHSMWFILLGRAEPERVQTGVVSDNFFDLLGVKPLLGRTFLPGEDKPGAAPVLVLSHEFWQRSFGGDPRVVGQVFEMNNKPHTVIGVTPPARG